jgi:CDP-diacylglycerol--glycerol-3-phosphate 3-phosphatidyltransferase
LVIVLQAPYWQWQVLGIGLLIILYLMDWFDGYVARLRNEVTELGAVLDVALDRAVENILWIVFMQLGLVPLWVPIVFLIRSFVIDGIRGVALTQGKSGFGMMYSPWGRFLVASRFMRAFYGLAKGWTFGFLILTQALTLKNPDMLIILQPWTQFFIILTAALCIIRGVPVILDGRTYFRSPGT